MFKTCLKLDKTCSAGENYNFVLDAYTTWHFIKLFGKIAEKFSTPYETNSNTKSTFLKTWH